MTPRVKAAPAKAPTDDTDDTYGGERAREFVEAVFAADEARRTRDALAQQLTAAEKNLSVCLGRESAARAKLTQ